MPSSSHPVGGSGCEWDGNLDHLVSVAFAKFLRGEVTGFPFTYGILWV